MPSSRQSVLIKAMRFPLIVMVLFVHSPGAYPSPTVEWSMDGNNIYHFVTAMLSGHVCAIATRWFFLLSGYLFFRYLKEPDFCFQWVIEKWKKRFWSLLIPFLIWNSFAVLAVVLKNGLFSALSLGRDASEWELISQGPLYWFFTGPADFPLWFLRDLIIMTLVAPVLHLFFKKYRWLSLSLLIIALFSMWSPKYPTMQAFFYYGIGIWLGIHGIDLLSIGKRFKAPAAIAALILLPITTSQIGRPLHPWLFRLFIPCGMIAFMNLCDSMIANERRCQRLCNLSASVFFIYAVHEIYILGWTKGLLSRLLGNGSTGLWISYFLVPIVVLGVCLGLYTLLNRVMPRTLAFVCGGRSKQ